MLSPGLVNNLDNLAREGIIDYDAASFILGTKPRYIGNPTYQQLPLPDMSDVDTSNLKQPEKDEMHYTHNEAQDLKSKNPLWKKALFAVVAGGLLIFGGRKLIKLKPVQNLINKFMNLFKKKTP